MNPDWAIAAPSAGGFFIVRAVGSLLDLVFSLDNQAPGSSFRVSNNGNVGLGTFSPARKLHLVTGDTPTLRLEQNGSGFPPQTWDIGANDVNFTLNDITGGRTPFVIQTGAPTASLVITPNGKVGFGTFSPQGNLHIKGGATQDIFNGMGPDLNNGPAFNFGYSGSSFGLGSGFFNVRPAPGAVALNPSLRFATANVQRLIITNIGRVGIGTLSPTQQLDVSGNIRASGSLISGGTTLNVPDYVFEPDYKLRPLAELAVYVEKKKHLPDIPSAREIKEQGVNVNELQMQLLKKVEELTLYTLEQEQTIQEQEKTTVKLKETVTAQQAALTGLDALNTRLTALEHKEEGKPH